MSSYHLGSFSPLCVFDNRSFRQLSAGLRLAIIAAAISVVTQPGCKRSDEAGGTAKPDGAQTREAQPATSRQVAPAVPTFPAVLVEPLRQAEDEVLKHWAIAPRPDFQGATWVRERQGRAAQYRATFENVRCATKEADKTITIARKLLCIVTLVDPSDVDQANGVDWTGSIMFDTKMHRTYLTVQQVDGTPPGWTEWQPGGPVLLARDVVKKRGVVTMTKTLGVRELAEGRPVAVQDP